MVRNVAFALVGLSTITAPAFTLPAEIEGKIESRFGVDGLSAELRPLGATAVASRVLLEYDGSFRLRAVADGSYEFIVRNAFGDSVAQQFVNVAGVPLTLTIRLTESAGAKAPPPGAGAVVAAGVLAHPPSGKALKLAESALRLSAEGNHGRAATELQKAIALSPDYAEARNNLGAQYLYLKRYLEAAEQLEAAVHIAPSSQAYANLSLAYSMTNRAADAESAARRAVALDASNPRSHFRLGAVLADRPSTRDEAIRELRIAASRIPSAYGLLARLYLDAGQPVAAEEMRRLAGAPPR